VSLATFVEDSRDWSFLVQPERHCEKIAPVLRRDYRPLSLYPYEPFEEFNSPNFEQALKELLAERDFDLVHFEWTQMAMYSGLFPKIPKLMTEIEVNYAAQRTQVAVERNPLKKIKLYYNSLQTLYRELEMCRRVNRVVCVTSEDSDYLNGYVEEEKLEVINTGVDTGYFHYNMGGNNPNSIVFVGAFRHSPNLDAMQYFSTEIFPIILEARPQTHLYIVGSSPPREIQQMGKRPNITVTGFVEDIRDYYRLAQVVIVPLRTGVGIRGKILEGWATGRAMVATPLACQGIDVIHGDNIMIADNARDFAKWTIALLNNPDHCTTLGLHGRETVERKYDWDFLGNQMIDLYESLGNSTGVS
jgi:glycosyltransferase involved in cell wall biosynthesis